jgi:hypothetical protein
VIVQLGPSPTTLVLGTRHYYTFHHPSPPSYTTLITLDPPRVYLATINDLVDTPTLTHTLALTPAASSLPTHYYWHLASTTPGCHPYLSRDRVPHITPDSATTTSTTLSPSNKTFQPDTARKRIHLDIT